MMPFICDISGDVRIIPVYRPCGSAQELASWMKYMYTLHGGPGMPVTAPRVFSDMLKHLSVHQSAAGTDDGKIVDLYESLDAIGRKLYDVFAMYNPARIAHGLIRSLLESSSSSSDDTVSRGGPSALVDAVVHEKYAVVCEAYTQRDCVDQDGSLIVYTRYMGVGVGSSGSRYVNVTVYIPSWLQILLTIHPVCSTRSVLTVLCECEKGAGGCCCCKFVMKNSVFESALRDAFRTTQQRAHYQVIIQTLSIQYAPIVPFMSGFSLDSFEFVPRSHQQQQQQQLQDSHCSVITDNNTELSTISTVV